jgi:hypothetical protein
VAVESTERLKNHVILWNNKIFSTHFDCVGQKLLVGLKASQVA